MLHEAEATHEEAEDHLTEPELRADDNHSVYLTPPLSSTWCHTAPTSRPGPVEQNNVHDVPHTDFAVLRFHVTDIYRSTPLRSLTTLLQNRSGQVDAHQNSSSHLVQVSPMAGPLRFLRPGTEHESCALLLVRHANSFSSHICVRLHSHREITGTETIPLRANHR